MAIGFIQYPLMISPENVYLDKTNSAILNLRVNMFYFIIFIFTKIEWSTILIDQNVEIQFTRFFELCLKLF